jgi:hypothetical protein
MKLKIVGFGKKNGAPFGRDEKGKLIFLGKDNKLKIGDLIECEISEDHDKVYIADFKKLLPPEGPMKQSQQPQQAAQQKPAQEAVACKINGKNRQSPAPAPVTPEDMHVYHIDAILDVNTKNLVINNPFARQSVKRFIDDIEKGKIK